MKKIVAYARLLRIPGLGALAMPPVIGAMTVGIFDIQNLLIIFILGAFAAIYGFILNDYIDVEVDKLSKALHGKPLVSGEISRTHALFISILLIFFSFLLLFYLWIGTVLDDYKYAALICVVQGDHFNVFS